MENLPLYAFALAILTTACGIVWRLTRVEIGLRAENAKIAADARAEIAEKAAAIMAKFYEAKEEQAKEVAALKEKLYQVEIWARDQFVRKGSFEIVVSRLETSMTALGNKIEGVVDRMTSRIETLNNPDHQRK